MNYDFLPEKFDSIRTKKPYINLSKLAEGEHRFRIVGRPIAGWIDWKDNKPYRFRPDAKPKAPFDADKPLKPFWAMHVWSYQDEGLYIMEVTQSSIRRSLEGYATNEDWGDFKNYDIKIKKEGTGKDTEYSVIPVPHKPMSEQIKQAIEDTPVRLESLYEGKDPWLDLEESVSVPVSSSLTEKEIDVLDGWLAQLESENIEEFICKRAGIEHVHQLPRDKFEGVIAYLEQQVTLKNSKEKKYANNRS